METTQDYKELLKLLNENEVKYLIVGAHALAFYGAPRLTGDLDIFVDNDKSNAGRVFRALSEFGFSNTGLSEEDFTSEDIVVQLGYPPVRIDIMTSLTGVSWDEAWTNREVGKYGEIEVFYLNKKLFISNKTALGRKKDLADLEAIGEI